MDVGGAPSCHHATRPPAPLWLLYSSLGLSTLAIAVGIPIIPLFAGDFTTSATLIGVVVAMRWVARLFVNIPAGLASERWGASAVFLAGSLVILAAGVLSASATNLVVLLTARVVEGIGSALTMTAAMAIVAERAEAKHRGRMFGHLQTAMRIGYWIGPVIGGAVAGARGLRVSLWVYAALAVFAILPAALLQRDKPRRERVSLSPKLGALQVVSEAKGLFQRSGFAVGCAVSFVIFFTMTGAQFTAVPLFIENVLDLGPAMIGWSLFAGNAVAFALIYPSALASDKYSRRGTIALLLFVGSLGVFWLPYTTSVTGLITASALLGAGNALRGPAMNAYIVDSVKGAPVGPALGIFRSIGDLGSALGPVAAGGLLVLGTTTFFIFNGVLTVGVLVVFLLATRSHISNE